MQYDTEIGVIRWLKFSILLEANTWQQEETLLQETSTYQIVKREKTNKMQQSGVHYQLLSRHVSGIVMPIFRRTKTVC